MKPHIQAINDASVPSVYSGSMNMPPPSLLPSVSALLGKYRGADPSGSPLNVTFIGCGPYVRVDGGVHL